MARAAVKTKNKAKPSAGSVKGTKRLKGAKRSKREPCSEPPEDALASAERYALALESINENLYDWDIVNDTVYFAPGLFKILGHHARADADAEGLDRPDPSRRPAAVQIHAGGTSQGQHAALFDGVALSRRRRQLALGAAGRHRGARARRPRASHGRRGRRHHRGQARRRGDDRVGRSVEGDEPFDVRAADRARHSW